MMRLTNLCVVLLVAMFLVAAAAPAVAGEIKGKVKSVEPDKFEFVIEDNTGKTITFMMDEDAQVLINGLQVGLGDLRRGDEVTIAGRRDGDNWMAIEVRCKRNK
jgi:hypothetical protein